MIEARAYTAGVLLGAAFVGFIGLYFEPALQGTANEARRWLANNLGLASWLFLATAVAWTAAMGALLKELAKPNPRLARVQRLDQVGELCAHLFVGIGVIWTAIGMRDALQAALGEGAPGGQGASADAVLRALVDGGILVALSTTIVGGIGGYLFRLLRALLAAGPLQELHEQTNNREIRELVQIVGQIQEQLAPAAITSPAGSQSCPPPRNPTSCRPT